MTQDVDPKVYYSIGTALFQRAGSLYDGFNVNIKILGGTGAMAGTDDAGKAWAASYDERVKEVLGAANDMIKSLENYGGVIIQAGYNHAVAEHNATPGAKGPAPTMPPDPQRTAGVLSAPPSAGGPGRGLIDVIGLMEEMGVPVPDGDTDKLSTAEQAWDRLATVYQITTIVDELQVDARVFSDTHSPEVEYIVQDLGVLGGAMTSLMDGCAELSQSCKDYKAALDALRAELKDILKHLEIEIAATLIIVVAASFLTVGGSIAAGAAKTAEAVRRYAKIIGETIGMWRIAKNIASGVKKARDIAGLRDKLQRFTKMERKGKPEESQVGPGVKTVEETPLSINRSQVEKKFDSHARDFGIQDARGKIGFEKLEQAIRQEVHNPSTMHISGTYRGEPAIINYNPNTGIAVIQKPSGEFVSGWRLGVEQIKNLLERGALR